MGDIVRGSITVKSPREVFLLIERFKQLELQENKMQVVRVVNRYSQKADTLQGYRNVEINIHWDGGMQPSFCGRQGRFLHLAFVGEDTTRREAVRQILRCRSSSRISSPSGRDGTS